MKTSQNGFKRIFLCQIGNMETNLKNDVVFTTAILVPNSCLAETLIRTEEAPRTKNLEKGEY
jgi:hypothetical protein